MAGSRIWDFYAPVYDLFMRRNRSAAAVMYRRICTVIRDKDVLEIAAGTGELARRTAVYARHMVAVDISEGMLARARKKGGPKNLVFRYGDAMDLPFGDETFDVVIIANALHIVPDALQALREIRRVLKPQGILIAPNYLHTEAGDRKLPRLSALGGIRFARRWDEAGYRLFLQSCGFEEIGHQVLNGAQPLMYIECRRREDGSEAGSGEERIQP